MMIWILSGFSIDVTSVFVSTIKSDLPDYVSERQISFQDTTGWGRPAGLTKSGRSGKNAQSAIFL